MSNDQLMVLKPNIIRQLDEKLAQAMQLGYAEITLIIEKGRLRWIRGPAPSVPAATDEDRG